MQRSLTRYKIGLAVLGVFTLVLLIVVLAQAGSTKQDTKTYGAANKAADALNDYSTKHGKGPSSLDKLSLADTDNLSYKLNKDGSFKFCATYKTKSTGFDATSVETTVLSGGHNYDDDTASSSDKSYLYMPATHKKGENCQTITSYSYDSYNSYDDSPSSSSNSSDPYATCDKIPLDQDAEYQTCIDTIEKQPLLNTKLN